VELTEDLSKALENEHPSSSCIVAAAAAATFCIHGSELELATRLLTTAEHAARHISDPATHAALHAARSMYALAQADPARFLDLAQRAVAAYDQVGDLRGLCNQRLSVGFGMIELGDPGAAAVLTECIEAAERLGLSAVAVSARHNLGFALWRQRRLQEAREHEERAADELRQQGSRRLEGGARAYLAGILTELGELPAAEAAARTAVELLDGMPANQSYALAMLSRVLLAAGRADEALMEARGALAASTSAGIAESSGFARLVLAEAFEACGDRTRATQQISLARAALLARAQNMPDESRRTFLDNIPEHRRTLELAAAWSAPRDSDF
jgi:tetratricopeptide (TPR) repeat protein